jgi:hypothetical protein
MPNPSVHNYAFRKALGYVRNKKGKQEYEAVQATFQNAVHQVISNRPPYVPLYLPMQNFIMLLQIIRNRLGDDNVMSAGTETNRFFDIGFYLYVGPEEKDSPYTFLDPNKPLITVVTDFYHNLVTPSAIIRECTFGLQEEESKLVVTWDECSEYMDLFPYLQGLHGGMIKAATTNGSLSSRQTKNKFIFEIELLD